jgi:ADP-ribosylglycohydrolase
MSLAAVTIKDRILGCILGVFIGDALGVGVHWQYDLNQLERDRGGYVTGYLDPLPGTYHSGTADAPGRGSLKAGQLEQQGMVDKILLQSLVDKKRLDQDDFHERLEREILLDDETMDGTRQGGKYGWTDKTICNVYQKRIVLKQDWSECVSARSDTPDPIVRSALIAALYHATPREMCRQVQSHAKCWTADSSVQAHSVAFACLVAGVLQGLQIDKQLSSKLYTQAGKVLPFTTVHSELGSDEEYGPYTEPDSLLWFGQIAQGLESCRVEPPHRGIELYGKFCAFFAVVPSAYYCAARFPDHFEHAILCAINGGGQTTMRASLVGALVGAHVGLSGIPRRFIDGLEDALEILALAEKLADASIGRDFGTVDAPDAWDWPSEKDLHPIGVKNRRE